MSRVPTIGFVLLLSTLGGSAWAYDVIINGGRELPNGVPNYSQISYAGDNDCGPTAAAMLLGFYDANGWPNLVQDARPYYTRSMGPSAGHTELDRVLKSRLPYRGWAGTYSLNYTLGQDVSHAAADIDSGARYWQSSDSESVSQESLVYEVNAKRPSLLLVKGTYFDYTWDSPYGSGGSISFHWMTTIGYRRDGEFYLVLRSGWADGGDSTLWYNWSFWDDLISVRVWPNGSPETSVGPHVLASFWDGSAVLKTMNGSETAAVREKFYGPYSGWTATCYQRTETTPGVLLWSSASGYASLWTLNRYDDYAYSRVFGPYPGYAARGYTRTPDGRERILWADQNGNAFLQELYGWWGTVLPTSYSKPGWRATDYSTGRDGTMFLLWTNGYGRGEVWALDVAGRVLRQTTLSAPDGGYAYSAVAFRDGSRGARILWASWWGDALLQRPAYGYSFLNHRSWWTGSSFQSVSDR